MNDEKLKAINEKTTVSNSRLEELMKEKTTPEKQIVKTLKDSRLFLPVIFRKNRNDDVKNESSEFKGEFEFDISCLPDRFANDTVPLFTSSQIMHAANFKISSAILISMRDLAQLLRQTEKYSSITLNPFAEFSFDMPIDDFLNQWGIVSNHKIKDIKNEKLKELLHKDFTDNHLEELKEELLTSTMVVPGIYESEDADFITFEDNNEMYLPMFTDLNEFERVFGQDKKEIYPQAYHFTELVKAEVEYLVINPKSDSLVLNRDMFELVSNNCTN